MCTVQVRTQDEDEDEETLESYLQRHGAQLLLAFCARKYLWSERVERGSETPEDRPEEDVVHGVSQPDPGQHLLAQLAREDEGYEGEADLYGCYEPSWDAVYQEFLLFSEDRLHGATQLEPITYPTHFRERSSGSFSSNRLAERSSSAYTWKRNANDDHKF